MHGSCRAGKRLARHHSAVGGHVPLWLTAHQDGRSRSCRYFPRNSCCCTCWARGHFQCDRTSEDGGKGSKLGRRLPETGNLPAGLPAPLDISIPPPDIFAVPDKPTPPFQDAEPPRIRRRCLLLSETNLCPLQRTPCFLGGATICGC